MSILPRRRAGRIAVVLFAVFFIAMNPPVINFVNRAETFGGFAQLYVWYMFWAFYMAAALLWAAKNDAFSLTEDQVPPELREREDIVTTGDA